MSSPPPLDIATLPDEIDLQVIIDSCQEKDVVFLDMLGKTSYQATSEKGECIIGTAGDDTIKGQECIFAKKMRREMIYI